MNALLCIELLIKAKLFGSYSPVIPPISGLNSIGRRPAEVKRSPIFGPDSIKRKLMPTKFHCKNSNSRLTGRPWEKQIKSN